MDKQTKGISQVNFPWNHGYSPQNPIVSLDRSDLPDEFDSGVIEYQLKHYAETLSWKLIIHEVLNIHIL